MNKNLRGRFYFSYGLKQGVEENKGITLIALVITIIVLLILAGVSIAMLTGENGILNQAQEAKNKTAYKSAEEKVKLAIMGARADDGQMTVEELKREVEYQGGSVTGDTFSVEIQMDGYTFTVDDKGEFIQKDTLGIVTGQETQNTIVYDKLGNQVIVPAGFKVQNPDQTVPDGIVIEDVSHEATKGSEFVWIPVGIVKNADGNTVTIKLSRYTFDEKGKEIEQGDTVTIKLSRYTFDEKGKEIEQGENAVQNAFQELEISNKENMTAKDINTFKKSGLKNKGYYIGRYEARTTTKRTTEGDELTQITEKPEEFIYNYVTQLQAAELSRNMYTDVNFESDLINSYAWDTAITFVQAFDNRKDKEKAYSQQNSLNTVLAETGTNNLEIKDIICNIYDIASNTIEWSTESCSSIEYPCVMRGGICNDFSYCASRRGINSKIYSNPAYTFRPIIYL